MRYTTPARSSDTSMAPSGIMSKSCGAPSARCRSASRPLGSAHATPFRRRRHDGRARSGPVGCDGVDRPRTNRRAGARGPPCVAATRAESVPQADRLDRRRPVRSPVQRPRRRTPRAAACFHRARAPPARAARLLGAPHAGVHGLLRAAGRRDGDRLSRGPAGLGGAPVSEAAERRYDVVIIGSGAGGGTVAQELAPLVRDGRRVVVLEKGPRLGDAEFTGRELEMAAALYADTGGFLTADGTMTLAFASVYGGSTVVYTGTSLTAPERVIRRWSVPGLDHADIVTRSERFAAQNGVHLLEDSLINDNNRLFVEGGRKAGFRVEQFPVYVQGCRGSSLCNLGCPNQAKQGTNRVQLPRAERAGVEVVTRAEALRIEPDRTLTVRVSQKVAGTKGAPSEWAPGDYAVRARIVVAAAGAIGTSALLLRSPLPAPRSLGHGFTCHPALILVAEHPRPITNDVGHPKSYFVDHGASERFVLETCMYFPFVTAKSLTGFGATHSAIMHAFPRLQMILILACDHVASGNRIAVSRTGSPIVHYRLTPETIDGLVRGTRAAARIFFAAGARRVHAPADPPLLEIADADRLEERVTASSFRPGMLAVSAAHLMGGCGMGRTAADSVTDAWGRVHGLPWLRVADASLFPDSLEINPYLTIMGLADRVAEGVRRDLAVVRD